MKNNRGFFDVAIEVEEIARGSSIGEYLDLKDLQNRKLHLNEDIDQLSINDTVKNILQYNRDDKDIPVAERKPIYLYVASNGGNVDAGFELIDTITLSKTPVYTINMGNCYSMGFLILLAGHKRFAMPSSKCLMHDGSDFVYDSSSKVNDRLEFNRRLENRIRQYILSRSRLTEKEYDEKLRVEWYLFADEAKEKGFVDYIVGTDCHMDDVI